ncbi:HAD-IA family hydrolase [Frateuria sp. STR12]|uniref:HAD-IA family hydrolase n=1 Tax=Frateuria hangzhouensis TaxID=2995589 RepID=UPI00226086DB|nr:HAD-IA family hydrolase [Frateuria sp. STR12]MCX7514572.1 HAD-IA family hydrolase [Frateuria sp. STR12]
MRLNVVVIAGGGFQGQGLVEAIHAVPGGRAIIADSTRDAIGELLADRYVQVPPLDPAGPFEDFLLELVRAENIDLVVPATQRELMPLARIAGRLQQAGAHVAVCPAALLDTLLDKRALYAALAAARLPVQALVELSPLAVFPLFGRPRSGWGGQGKLRLDSHAQAQAAGMEALAQSHAWVRFLDAFEELSVDFAIDFDGRLSPLTLRKRVRTSGGFAVISQTARDPEALTLIERLGQWLLGGGARGLFNVQLLRTPDGQMFISDVNPRHGTSSGHALAEGNNLVAFLLGRSGTPGRREVRTFRPLRQQAVPVLPQHLRGVVFDLDDTLLDHKRWMLDRMELASRDLADDIAPGALLSQTYVALEEGEHARLIDLVAAGIGRTDLRDRLLAAYRAAVPARAVLHQEVLDVLRTLREMGFGLALLTDNPPASQRAKLAAAPGLAEAFDAVVFAREHGAEKPAPAAFEAAAAALGLAPGKLMMVGDNPARDAMGAIAAGYASCLLVQRPGGRFQVHETLLARCAPDVASRTWTATDLRVLPLALRQAGS